MKRLPFLIAVGIAFAGCQDTPVAPIDGPDLLGEIGTIRYAPPPEGTTESATTEQRLAFLDDVSTAMDALVTAVEGTEGWSGADAAIQAALDRLPAGPRVIGEQIGAVYMLKAHFSTGELDRDRAEAAFRYASELVERRSPESVVIADALTSLRGAVPPHQFRSLAAAAAATAEVNLQEATDCSGCTTREVIERLADVEVHAPDVSLSAQAEAAQTLRTLAET